MLENLEIVQRLIEWLGLSENTATIVLSVLKLTEGAVLWQGVLFTWKAGRWLLTSKPPEAVDTNTLQVLQGATWNAKTQSLVSGDLVARRPGGTGPHLEVILNGVSLTDVLSARTLNLVRGLIDKAQREYEREVAQYERKEQEQKKQRFAELLAKRV